MAVGWPPKNFVNIRQNNQLNPMINISDRAKQLKAEDVERIYYAKEVLLTRLDNPPSLIELARLTGINDCKLKAGVRCLAQPFSVICIKLGWSDRANCWQQVN